VAGTRVKRLTTSTRDLTSTRDVIERWLTTKLPLGARPHVSELEGPPTNGSSSVTIMFDAWWTEHGRKQSAQLVGRIAPDPTDFPVFPTYDIPAQFKVMAKVRELSKVPVPEPLWLEPDASVLGQPFLVMRRVDAHVPPDVLPYPFGGNWLYDATRDQQRRVQHSSVQVLADIHAIPDVERHFSFLNGGVPGETALRRHYQLHVVDYYEWAAQITRSPLIERCLEHLEASWPEAGGQPVLSWGDARIGNVLYRDFEAAAVLDWEMASIGPREIDVGWFVYFHRFFEDLVQNMGHTGGMPHFLRRDDVVATYERMTGHACTDMDWFCLLAATRHAVIELRTGFRRVQFGEAQMPEDRDDLILHRSTLEQMLDGAYWEQI